MEMPLSEEDLEDVLQFTIALAKRAGAVILEGSVAIKSQRVDEKKNAVDLVTEWDVKVENLVKTEISQAFPSFKFIGEESYSSGDRPELTDDPTFCVDPIDGTTNFVHGFPYACISLGLIYQKRPIIGVIFNPFLDQLFSALKGHGAYLNGVQKLPLHPPSPLSSLSSALIGIEYGSDRSKGIMDKKLLSFGKLSGDPVSGVVGGKMAHSLRSIGSAALNYALVASGSLDIYWEIGTWPWDICAGVVIAQEAGGLVSGASDASLENDVTEDILNGRKHIVIRAVADTEQELGLAAQKRIVKEFYDTVEEWDPV